MKIRDKSPFYSVANFLSRKELYEIIGRAGFKVIRVLGTLSYGPEDEPRVEEPSPDNGELGFICAEAVKP